MFTTLTMENGLQERTWTYIFCDNCYSLCAFCHYTGNGIIAHEECTELNLRLGNSLTTLNVITARTIYVSVCHINLSIHGGRSWQLFQISMKPFVVVLLSLKRAVGPAALRMQINWGNYLWKVRNKIVKKVFNNERHFLERGHGLPLLPKGFAGRSWTFSTSSGVSCTRRGEWFWKQDFVQSADNNVSNQVINFT